MRNNEKVRNRSYDAIVIRKSITVLKELFPVAAPAK